MPRETITLQSAPALAITPGNLFQMLLNLAVGGPSSLAEKGSSHHQSVAHPDITAPAGNTRRRRKVDVRSRGSV